MGIYTNYHKNHLIHSLVGDGLPTLEPNEGFLKSKRGIIPAYVEYPIIFMKPLSSRNQKFVETDDLEFA